MTVLNHNPRNMSAAPVEPEAEPLYAPTITIATTVVYRGRALLITSEGYSADEFCTMLDRRFGPPSATTAPSSAPPICPVHHKAMREMTRPDRAGHTHWCTAKTDAGFCSERG
jgi:hypothetical protein